jgi:MSHA biogenesis protein MshL
MQARLAMVISLSLGLGIFSGCAANRNQVQSTPELTRAEVATAPTAAVASVPTRVSEALAEPVVAVPATPEPRLDLLVNNAQARDVFLAIVADSRYSMLMHPDVSGTLSVTLRGVTVQEALESIRDVYGYDFKMDGRRITVYAPTLQTRIFTVNYPNSQRQGVSELRVSAGLVAGSGGNSGGSVSGTGSTSPNTSGGAAATGSSANGSSQQTESSRISTSSHTDFWTELTDAVKGMVGKGEGRSVFTSPQAGIMAVKAMPEELRQVDKFLKAARIAVERQVMLEAKIVQVELSNGYQSGIDWSGLRNVGKTTAAIGVTGGGANNVLSNGAQANLPGFPAPTGTPLLADNVPLPTTGGGMFGLALATTGFQAVLGFLETRGDVQILSSPRIATLNNQKAVLKVGTDAYFVTNVSSGTAATSSVGSGTSLTMPSLTLTPFFSGIALDVTPQIDEANNITLHIHPSVTTVTEVVKQINLGAAGNYQLPLPSSSVNESDTMVRLLDGNIVAIGGLMQVESSRTSSGMPGTSDVPFFSSLLGNKANTGSKKELVVLIKPSIVRTAQDWEQQTHHAHSGVEELDSAHNRIIRLDGSADAGLKPAATP